MLLYCLVLDQLLEEVKLADPTAAAEVFLQGAYADDLSIIGKIEAVRRIHSLVETLGKPLGIHLNEKKSIMWWAKPKEEEWANSRRALRETANLELSS